jgi:hypothetical protein
MKSILSLFFLLVFLSSANGQNIGSDSSKVAVVPSTFQTINYGGSDTIYSGKMKYVTTILSISESLITYQVGIYSTLSTNTLTVDSVYLYNKTLSMVSTSNKHFGMHLKTVARLQIITMLAPFVAILVPEAALPVGIVTVLLGILQIHHLHEAGKQAIKQDQTDGRMYRPTTK